jgi:hypothetical protein
MEGADHTSDSIIDEAVHDVVAWVSSGDSEQGRQLRGDKEDAIAMAGDDRLVDRRVRSGVHCGFRVCSSARKLVSHSTKMTNLGTVMKLSWAVYALIFVLSRFAVFSMALVHELSTDEHNAVFLENCRSPRFRDEMGHFSHVCDAAIHAARTEPIWRAVLKTYEQTHLCGDVSCGKLITNPWTIVSAVVAGIGVLYIGSFAHAVVGSRVLAYGSETGLASSHQQHHQHHRALKLA